MKDTNVCHRSLFYWAFKGNGKLQAILFVIITVIVFARVLPLEMQKRIINDAIALQKFEQLVIYCAIYLASVTLASLLKLAINYIQSVLGERAMYAMREALYAHILTLPLGFFRKTQPGMVVSSLMTELSAAGTFAGMAFAVPITNILTLVAFAVYLAWLHTSLALLTLIIYPAVVFILPLLQKRANKANKQRVDIARKVSSQIAESISGIQEIQVHGAYGQENRKFDNLISNLKKIRIRWSLLKFGIKTTNNYFVSLGPFLVFIYGGYLVMNGNLELGAMVAFLSAQEKLYDPWKELIDFYQVYQDASIRYKRTMEYFDHQPEFLLAAPQPQTEQSTADVEVKNLCFEISEGKLLLDHVSFSLKAGEHMALVGFSGSGKSTLIQCIAKMYQYTSGDILLGGKNLAQMSKNDLVEDLGYIAQRPFIFTGTVADNLLYADQAAQEANLIDGDYTEPDLDRMILALQQAGFFLDVMRFGLDTIINPESSKIIEGIIRGRERFHQEFSESLAQYVEFYEENTFLYHSSLMDNILFGVTETNDFQIDLGSETSEICLFLIKHNLADSLETFGRDIASEVVSLTEGMTNADFILEHSPLNRTMLERARDIFSQKKTLKNATKNSLFFCEIALLFTPSIHTMVALSEELEELILKGRKDFRRWAKRHHPDLLSFSDPKTYIHGQSLLNNLFFGKPKHGMPHAQDKINQAIIQLLIEEDVLEKVALLGMQFSVGTAGDKLSGGQRQKLAIARVLLKNPSIVIMDEATSALDNASQTRIQKLIDTRWKKKKTVIAVIHRMDDIASYDKIGVMKSGNLVEQGSYDELIEQKGIFYELMYGKH